MRSTLLPPVFLVLLLALPAAWAEDDASLPVWKLHPSELLHYERRVVRVKDGKEVLGGAARVSVFGHDLRDEGQYRPISPTRSDLPALLALRLPTTVSGERKWKLDITFPNTIPLRLKGKTWVSGREEATTLIAGAWTFGSRGSGERGDTHEIVKGKAEVSASFDTQAGHLLHARVVLRYRRAKLKASSAEKPESVDKVFDLKLKRRHAFRYDGFQAAVDKAIEKGVAYVRTLQIKPGEEDADSYTPHGKHKIGSTALAVLTLAACGVPRDDPSIAKALDWLVLQTPAQTYDRALCLMAFDKAFTPPGEHERLSRGKQKRPRRELSKAQRRWVFDVADQLVRSAKTPGSWGYPSGSRALLQLDTSNTQYAVLGMRAATNLGFEIKEGMWTGVIRHFRAVRERKPSSGAVKLVRPGEAVHDDGRYADTTEPEKVKAAGGFRYSTLDGHPHPWGSMTCAGIACLAIARNALERMGSTKLTPGLKKEIAEMMLGGWAWLEAHWGVDRHPMKSGNNWYYYYLYSLERAAVLDRVRRVGLKDWYFEGAMQLLLRQGGKGNWDQWGGSDLAETCFALLFLKRATAPLVTTGG